MNVEILQPLVNAVIAAPIIGIGWYVVHRLNSARDLANKRRELTIQFLLEAYRRLEAGAEREKTEDQTLAFESALADIQLFGDQEQIDAATRFMYDQVKSGNGNVSALLESLRNSMRKQMGLPLAAQKTLVFRFERVVGGVDGQIATITDHVRAMHD